MDRVAGASELPVLGPLFRSRQFRDRQTELVVFITPRFVEGAPMPAEAAALRVEPMREPRRMLPAMPVLPPAGEPAPVTGEVTATEAAEAVGLSDRPWAPPPAPTQPSRPMGERSASSRTEAEAAARASEAERAALGGADRGTASRYRAGREKLRMVE
jgi:pilus assembly protein CpaC